MIAQQRPTQPMSGNSFFSQISSFFGGNSDQNARSATRRTTAFGSGFSSSSRRGPPQALDANAWSLPYSSRNNIPTSPAYANNGVTSPTDSHYPPAAGIARASSPYGHEHPSAISTSSVAEFSNMYATASTSTLVPGSTARAVSVSAGGSVPTTAYPPLRHTWNRIRKWSRKNYPEIGDTLNWPCTQEALDELEMTIGYTLPSCVRESYLTYDGQELESNQSCHDGLFFGAALLSLDQVAEEWKFWRAVDEDPETAGNPQVRNLMASCPHKWIRAEYSCRGWIPLITDHAGNYIGVDLSPHPAGGGAPGQVIIFGRDFDTKVVCWKGEGVGGWGRFLQTFADELEAGEFWTLEEPSVGSDDEEDMIGYESYFSGGGAGASQGGGDRGGEGAAGFRLTGEYKGWPILEAWADRSVRLWESVGLAPGKPLGNLHQPKPQSLVDRQSQRLSMLGGEAAMPPTFHAVDENGEAIDAEGSGSNRTTVAVGKELAGEVSVDGPAHPLADSSLACDTSAEVLIAAADETVPTERISVTNDTQATGSNGGNSVDVNLTPTNSTRRVSQLLSPPLPETKASLRKQKQREEGWGSPMLNLSSPVVGQVRRPVRPPPAPVQALDLPTIEDVKAIQAAALADDGKSHSVQFDSQSHGRSSFGNLGFRDLAGKIGAPGIGNSNGIGSPNGHAQRSESVELETRNSMENRSANNSYIVGQRGRARGLELENGDVETATKAFGGMNVGIKGAESPSLIDPGSTPGSPVVKSGARLGDAEVPAALA